MHKDLFPMEIREFVGIIILPVLMTLSTVAGVGGGGVVVPLIMVFYEFSTKKAIAISGFSILTSSLTRYVYTLNSKHPDKDAVVVDYGIASVMLPSVLIGSYIGVIFNVWFPALILQVVLTVLLIALTI